MVDSRILFFAPHGNLLKDGVLQSQFLGMASFLQSSGAQCLVVGLCGVDENTAEVEKAIFDKFGLVANVYRFEVKRFRPIKNRRLPRVLFDFFRGPIRDFSPTHVYTRTPRALLAAHNYLKNSAVQTIYDARGIIAAEYLLTYERKNLTYKNLKYLENRALRKANRLACVTSCLAEYILDVTGRKVDAVIPCCVSEHFCRDMPTLDRAKLGFNSRHKIFCYAGGTSKWQRIEDIISLCLNIASAEPDARFLFVSNDADSFAKITSDYEFPEPLYKIVSCSHEEVHSYLQLCDAGIILRHNNLVNNVASPIKIGEYLAANLPVILNSGIGDFSDELPLNGVGVCVLGSWQDIDNVVNFVFNADREMLRIKCEKYIDKRLTWKSYSAMFEKLYGK